MPDFAPSSGRTPPPQQPQPPTPRPPPPPPPIIHTGPAWTKLTRPGYWVLIVVAAFLTSLWTGEAIGASTFWYGTGYWAFLLLYLPIAAWRARTMSYPWWVCFAAVLPIASIFMFFWLGLVSHAAKRPSWGRLILSAIAVAAILALMIMASLFIEGQTAPERTSQIQPAGQITQINAVQPQPQATEYCDSLLSQLASLSSTAMYSPETARAGIEIAAAQNPELPSGLGPEDIFFAELAINQAFATEANANTVVDWIHSRKHSECPPRAWNPWVTTVHHDSHGTHTILFAEGGPQRGFPVTPTDHLVFTHQVDREEPAPPEYLIQSAVSPITVTGLLVDGFEQPPDHFAVIQTHDGIQHCRMDLQDDAWQRISIGDTLTIRGTPADTDAGETPLLDLCTVTAWAPQP